MPPRSYVRRCPPQVLDEGEIEALALGLAEIQAMGDESLARASRSVLAKVAAILPDGRGQQHVHAIVRVFRPEPRYRDGIDLSPLRAPCWREEAAIMRYRDTTGALTEHETLPINLVYNERLVTVLAWCVLREDFRMCRSDRLD